VQDPDAALVVTKASLYRPSRRWLVIGLLAFWGPGLVVMLADTDVGSLITAAQSGAEWGYRMVLPQLVLIPILYFVQEMTVRLGILTGQGHAALIRDRFGRGWALLAAGTLVVSGIGALVTEFAGVAGVGEMFGISRLVSVPVAATFLIAIAMTGSYRRFERIGIAVGLAELVFIPAMLMAHPNPAAVLHGLGSLPLGSHSYLFLLAANVGAVIMPWMIFYQQGAVIDKGLSRRSMRRERQATAVGAFLTQLIMIMMVLALAATVGLSHPGIALNTVGQISDALRPFLGSLAAKVLLGAGLLGAALVAALVASLAGAWGLSEVFGWRHTLNQRPGREAAGFYLTYGLAHVVGAAVVLASFDLIRLAVDVEVLNALLLPVVLGFLLALEAKALPPEGRMHGWYRITVTASCLVVIGFGLFIVPATLGWV
jgi:NRAMP (natural resistance-associated macrophage protein)-like metal ion transporter